ncbi:adenylate cyclase [Rhizoctonia solani]|uniref:Adenylate cyclase n=1 Tax=Rhizoctonia solani TaxID=456999 RepID=A0A8H8NZJ5_9AGAM|nr:adenylate cyclase [Rhizoctonia solani]QRW21798.1 adenylate cyclase [Rhizoctonia solani]
MLCARLEALSSGRVLRDIALRTNSSAPNVMHANPALLMPDIRKEASDEDLLTILDSLSLRIENALGTIHRHQVSGYDGVLSQLAEAIRLNPEMIVQALAMYQGVMGMR